jgi:hypothetical protein
MDSSVRIATGEGLEGLKDRLPAGDTDFSLFHSVQSGPGAHPISYTMSMATVPQGVKRPEDEFHHSFHPVVELNFHSLIDLHCEATN